MTQEEFANKIKSKYPQYKDMDTATLVTKIVAKYPTYKSQITDLPKAKFGSETVSDIKETGKGIAETAKSGISKIRESLIAGKTGEQSLADTIFQVGGAAAGAVSGIAGEAVIGAGKTLLPQGAETAIGETAQKAIAPVVQSEKVQSLLSKYEEVKKKDPKMARDIDSLLGITSLGLDVATFGAGKGATTAGRELLGAGARKVATTTGEVVGKVTPSLKSVKAVASEVLPTAESFSSGNIAKSFGLTPTDVTSIEKTMGTSLSNWTKEKNVLKQTKAETEKALDDLYNQQYKRVREEVGAVDKKYTVNDVPRYKQVLEHLKKESSQIGLEGDLKEIDNLLKKEEFELNDVQRIKELVDDNYDLYSRSGDPAAGRTKEGLRNIREELKEFIEKEVKDNTGADIRSLNNDVASARKLLDKGKVRASRATTASEISIGDTGIFGVTTLASNPAIGAAAVFLKKVMQAPTIRLNIARMVQKMSKGEKAVVIKELQSGKIPKQFNRFIKLKKGVSKVIDNTSGAIGVASTEIKPKK